MLAFRRNLRSSFETSAESHNHPFQLLEGVADETETALTDDVFSAMARKSSRIEVKMRKHAGSAV